MKWLKIATAAILIALLANLAGLQIGISPANTENQGLFEIAAGRIVITIGPKAAYAAGVADYSCDGTNDRTQFQDALDALPPGGGKLVVFSGEYDFSEPSTGTVTRGIDNVTIQGVGAATYFKNNGSTYLFEAGGDNWVFSDLSTDAGSIDMGATTSWLWTNVTIDTQLYTYYAPTAGIGAVFDLTAGSLTAPVGRTATFVIAASDASAQSKAQADYVCDGTADQVQIQAAIDALPANGGKVVLSEGIYNISNPILPDSYTELEILGNLRIINAVTSLLTIDAPALQPNITVADASGFFIGQWVTIIDNDRAAHYSVRYGEGGTITNIVGNVITLSWNLTYTYHTAKNAFVSTSPCAIMAENESGIYIHGNGSIDGNKANQAAVATLSGPATFDEFQNHCGIALITCTDSIVKDVYVHDCNMHNFAFYACSNLLVDDVEANACNDKNIVFHTVVDSKIINSYCHNSVNEDGIILYANNARCVVANNISKDNSINRYAIEVGSSSNIVITGNYGEDGDIIYVANSSHVIVSSNICVESNNQGIGVFLSDDVIISGNTTYTTVARGVCGIRVMGSTKVKVLSNNIRKDGVGREGIQVVKSGATISQDVLVEGNLIHDTANGMEIEAGCQNIEVKNNNFRGVSGTIINDSGTNTIIEGNVGYITPSEIRTASGTLTAGLANAIAFAWHNPEAQDILIRKIVIEVTTGGGTVGSHLDVGIADYGTFGTHTGADNAAVLTDSTKAWTVNALVGYTLYNLTDASSTTVTANTANTITGVLGGGGDNDWDTGDVYYIAVNRGTEFFNDLLLNNTGVNDSWVSPGTQTIWVFCQDSVSVTDGWIVGQILDANASSLVARYYIEYVGR